LHAHHQCARQTGASGYRNAVDGGESDVSAFERRLDHGSHVAQMVARGQLGHDAAEGGMQSHLRMHDVAEDLPCFAHHGGSRLVTRGFDTEYQHCSPRNWPLNAV
jgi:hypothetical protein